MFAKILIANRGEIACRIMRTAQRLGVKTVAVFSDADANAMHVSMADEAVHIGASAVSESYLVSTKIIEAALKVGAEAIHPGYGFLSENPDFVEAVEKAGLVFIGPKASSIRAMGLKDAAKALMIEAGVPVVAGYHGANQDGEFLASEAEKIGYPVMIKARAGGGGKGMRLVNKAADFHDALASAAREGQNSFGDGAVLIEKFITAPRHIEVQVFGDSFGNVVHLFERDCSLQRRHQKVIEEAPAPFMTETVRKAMTDAAIKAARAINYEGAGTIEFIVDGSGPLRTDGFWFMEMNTRLQVEHPVTEAITEVDLVEWQLRVASGERLPLAQDEIVLNGHAFEARLYAEDVVAGFLPVTGRLAHLLFSDEARIDTGVRSGDNISPFYDPMIAKVITHGTSRNEALTKMRNALGKTHIAGTVTNLSFLYALCDHEGFARGEVDTGLIARNLDKLTAAKAPEEIVWAFASIIARDLDLATLFAGFRLWGDAVHKLTLSYDGENFPCTITIHKDCSISFEHAGNAICLKAITRFREHISAEMDGRKYSASFARYLNDHHETEISVLADRYCSVFTIPNLQNCAEHNNASGNALLAPMTGIIRLVSVKAGDIVTVGTRLMVLEAMKMEHAIVAPRDGVIEAIHCKQGDAIGNGVVLISFVAETT